MRDRISIQLRNLLNGFWLVPGLVAAAGAVLGVVLIEIDESTSWTDTRFFPGDPEAARVVLSVIAGSLITVAGLVLSITVLTLQLVSSQYTPRAVRSLMGDRLNQVFAGAFIGIFAYCLLVLRSVRADSVPSLAITVAIALGLLGLGLLLAFIHHFGQSIKVDYICARIARETLRTVERLYPDPFGEPEASPVAFTGEAAHLHVDRPGWVQALEMDRLAARLAAARSVDILVVPGDFVTSARPVAAVRPPEAADHSATAAFEIARERDLNQDVGFGLQQLADIAVRALSPGVNDPTTAVTCIGYLGAVLEKLAGQATPEPDRRFEHHLVVRAPGPSFARLLREAFLEIGRYAREDPRVMGALLEALERVGHVAGEVGASNRVSAVQDAAAEVAGPALELARTDRERIELAARAARVQALLP